MLFKTIDNTLKHVEVMVIMETLRFYVITHNTEYANNIHREKDSNIEDWLAGKLKIFQTYEDLQKYEEEQKKKEQLEKEKIEYVS